MSTKSSSWSSSSVQIDALPYIDDEYGDPKVKANVDRLIEDEMRRSHKKTFDYLKDLPPVAKLNFQERILWYVRIKFNEDGFLSVLKRGYNDAYEFRTMGSELVWDGYGD
ncbi:pre-mRNA-splicing factor SPF27 [Tanacetum coccineum]